jgi:diguanylate cyclase (GGDEF)-like protein/PAS domain S-box-containing protein
MLVAGVLPLQRTDSCRTRRILTRGLRRGHGEMMARKILLVLADAAQAKVARRSLINLRHRPLGVEWVNRCGDAIKRLGSAEVADIAAVVVDLYLPDSQGIETFDELFRASPQIPILILSRLHHEDIARLALRRGAQEYLLEERFDGDGFAIALTKMLERSDHAAALLLERERAQVTLDSIGDGIISIDVAGNITYLNPIAASMTGWSRPEAYGRPLQEVLRLIDGDSRDPAVNPLAMAILHNRTVGLSPHCVLIRRDGHESAIEDTAAPIHDRRGQVTGAVIVFHDVSKARAMSLRMSYLAQHDFLTGLPNRMLLNDRLSQAIALAHRHHSSLAVLFADVDYFKGVNDALGHAIGDRLLQSISRRLVACVRDTDTVCRLGGDEFVVLLSEVANAADAALSSDKILTALGAPHRIEQLDLNVTVSIGIGVYPGDGKDAETLLKNADAALSQAKANGGNTHQAFERDMVARGQRSVATAASRM